MTNPYEDYIKLDNAILHDHYTRRSKSEKNMNDIKAQDGTSIDIELPEQEDNVFDVQLPATLTDLNSGRKILISKLKED